MEASGLESGSPRSRVSKDRGSLGDQFGFGGGPHHGVMAVCIPDESAEIKFVLLHGESLLLVVFTNQKAKRACGLCRVPWRKAICNEHDSSAGGRNCLKRHGTAP